MKSIPSKGDRVLIVFKPNSNYGGKYVGEYGIIERFSGCTYGVRLDNHKNPGSGYGLFWFRIHELLVVENDKEETVMEEVQCVKISFMDEGQHSCRYLFAVYEAEIKKGDYVVVKTAHHGLAVGIVDEVVESGVALEGREVVCKFDMTAYNARKEKRKRVAELQRKMSQRFNELQKIAVYEMMAQTDDQMRDMLAELKSLQ